MKILITGGAGFIGSHLARSLIERRDSVTVLDDLSSGTLDNFDGVSDIPRLAFVAGSVLDRSLVRRLVEASDAVVHLAAAVGVRTVLRDPLGTIRTIEFRIISRHSKQREDCFQKAVIKRGLRCMRRSALRARSFSSP